MDDLARTRSAPTQWKVSTSGCRTITNGPYERPEVLHTDSGWSRARAGRVRRRTSDLETSCRYMWSEPRLWASVLNPNDPFGDNKAVGGRLTGNWVRGPSRAHTVSSERSLFCGP